MHSSAVWTTIIIATVCNVNLHALTAVESDHAEIAVLMNGGHHRRELGIDPVRNVNVLHGINVTSRYEYGVVTSQLLCLYLASQTSPNELYLTLPTLAYPAYPAFPAYPR